MRAYAFISHSSADQSFAERLAESLGRERVWIDFWNLDAGDVLPQDIAEAIHLSKWFILVASRKAMASRWVRYELSIMLVRWIQETDCRIIVVRIDDCEPHPELAPFVRVDCPGQPDKAIQKLTELVVSEERRSVVSAKERRRRIVDRFEEIAAIEELLHEEILFIYLWGMYGIGKTTIIERASQEVFGMPLARFPLTEAHGTLRLALELAARAKLSLPSPNASDRELTASSVESIIRLTEQGYLVFFDNVENALEEDGRLRPFLALLFDSTVKERRLQTPILLACTQRPHLAALPIEIQKSSHLMRIGPLKDDHLLYCLENWLRLAQPGQSIPERSKLRQAVSHLFGYPLAARLAAYYIVRYSAETLLKETRYFKSLRIDIAKQLLGRTREQLSDLEARCLEALAVADSGASLSELAATLDCDSDRIRDAVDNLASALIVFPEKGRLQIHPIVKDYFWSRAYESGEWREFARRMAEEARIRLSNAEPESEAFIHYCSKTYRLFAISGNLQEAQNLVYRFEEELREVSRRLFHAGEYDLALQYMNLWLDVDPRDRDTRWRKARCLTRLERYDEAESELSRLERERYRRYRLDHAWGLMRRDQGHLEEAAVFFRRGLDDRRDYIPLLRDLGDVLHRLGDVNGALDVLGHAHDLAPRDPYVAPRYVEVLEESGGIEEALSIMEGAISTFPEEPAFYHRMSTLLDKSKRLEEALIHARKAVELGATRLPEAMLHLAALEARCGNLEEAEALIPKLPRRLPKRRRQVRDTVIAEIKLRRGDLEAARASLKRYDATVDSYCADVLVRVELEDASRALGEGHLRMARDRLKRAKEIIISALKQFPGNLILQETKLKVDRLENELAE